MNSVHEVKKSFKCNDCEKCGKSLQKTALKAHMNTIHDAKQLTDQKKDKKILKFAS